MRGHHEFFADAPKRRLQFAQWYRPFRPPVVFAELHCGQRGRLCRQIRAARPMAAKTLLRHKNISTTTQFYVASVDAAARNGVDKISALFDNQIGSGRPN